MPTLGTVEVELKDGYVVSARDDSGSAWCSDAIVDFEVNDEGYLVYARYADGMVWVADPSPEIADVVNGLRAELEAPVRVAPPELKTVATPQPAKTPKARTRKAPAPKAMGPEPTAAKLKIVKARKTKRSRSPRDTMVRATNKAVFGSMSAGRRLASAAPPLGQSSYPRVASHLLVLGAVLTPMSFTVASAHTSPIPQGRITIPLTLDATKTEVATADELRAVAAAEAAPAPAPAAPAAAVMTETPKQAPTTRPFPQAQPAASSGGHFPWGWCTWYVSTKRYVPWMGNAIEWYSNAASMGFPEGNVPKVGAIMVTRESGWGHVAYVESVDGNGGFTVSEMNYKGFGIVSQRHFNSNPSSLVGFIY